MHILEAETAKIDDLCSSLKEYSADVDRVRPHIGNEQGVRKGLINPFLQKIGWPTYRLDRVVQEYSFPDSTKADFALLDKSSEPIIIIESKNIGTKIGKEHPPHQLKKYVNRLASCKVGAWTNGLEWYWFCDDHAHSLSGAAFVTFDVSVADWASPHVLQWLVTVMDQFDNPDPEELWHRARSYKYVERLRSGWSIIITRPTDDLAKSLMKELEIKNKSFSPADLKAIKSAWIDFHGLSSIEKEPIIKPPPPDPPLVGDILELSNGHILNRRKTRERAWRLRDHDTGVWQSWSVELTGVDVQVAVAEWLIGLNSGGLNPLLDSPDQKRLALRSDANPKGGKWRTIGNGTIDIFIHMSNPNRRTFLNHLAGRVRRSDGRTPKHGVDFEVWLPGGARKIKRK